MIGYCLDRQAVRTFRLDRVTHLQLAATIFLRPERFDARQYLAEHLPFVQSDYQIDLWIDLPLGKARRSFALWRVVMVEEGQGTRLRCGRDSLDFFAPTLLTTKRRIVVHSPAELRDTFKALAAQAMQAADEQTDR